MAGVSGVIYNDVGLQIDHAFRRWLIGTLKLGLGVDTYKGGSTGDTTLSATSAASSVIGRSSAFAMAPDVTPGGRSGGSRDR